MKTFERSHFIPISEQFEMFGFLLKEEIYYKTEQNVWTNNNSNSFAKTYPSIWKMLASVSILFINELLRKAYILQKEHFIMEKEYCCSFCPHI
ncbi:hypothetical protein T02_4590 [Trichinella nativa]|uniref:Uncharacterized protein n=1 Tax=Trichinella nativa TaxID=6335 RepID=A0A0V1L9I2_9BILA|nr:hypothetical protein T02_4590 [Trichinella nativa]